MADPVSGLIVVSLVARGAQAISQSAAAEEKLASLDLMHEENVLRHQQKTLSNFDTTQKVLDAQIAQATVRGVGLGSSSLEAIQRNTFNISSRRQSNLDIEESILDKNLLAEKENVKNTLFAELFGDVASGAADFFKAGNSMPTGGTV